MYGIVQRYTDMGIIEAHIMEEEELTTFLCNYESQGFSKECSNVYYKSDMWDDIYVDIYSTIEEAQEQLVGFLEAIEHDKEDFKNE